MSFSPYTDNLVTLRDWLRLAVSEFNRAGLHFGHGVDNAWDEAVWLLTSALRLPSERLELLLDARLTPQECERIFVLLQRRIDERIPTAYLLNEAWLSGLRFFVDQRVIIPRSFFGELLESGLAPWLTDAQSVEQALDLCTGSGCLAILMAHTFPAAQIDAVDIAPEALQVARRNIEEHGLSERVLLTQSDLFAALAHRRYDLILSNPPYVTAEAMARLPTEYRHEPVLALAAGEDGLNIVRRIIATARQHLTPHGLLLVEVGHNRQLVEAGLPALPLTWLDTPSADGKIFMLHHDDLPSA